MKNLLTLLLMIISVGAYGQPRYNMQQLKRESLNRGVVAIKDNNKVIISWRTLSSDKIGEEFNVYRNGTKINKKALSKGGTFFID
jgi:rhamnogalacturonan endolyase